LAATSGSYLRRRGASLAKAEILYRVVVIRGIGVAGETYTDYTIAVAQHVQSMTNVRNPFID
jgi:hypothetical protein